MRVREIGTALRLARQGLDIGLEFGSHAVEALLGIAQTVEESVYRAGSLTRSPDGLRFTLDNPPLRAGAFSGLRVYVDGAGVEPTSIEVRTPPRAAPRIAATLSPIATIDLVPGTPIEVRLAGVGRTAGERPVVRLELDCPAIPPLVWVEFQDTVRSEETG